MYLLTLSQVLLLLAVTKTACAEDPLSNEEIALTSKESCFTYVPLYTAATPPPCVAAGMCVQAACVNANNRTKTLPLIQRINGEFKQVYFHITNRSAIYTCRLDVVRIPFVELACPNSFKYVTRKCQVQAPPGESAQASAIFAGEEAILKEYNEDVYHFSSVRLEVNRNGDGIFSPGHLLQNGIQDPLTLAQVKLLFALVGIAAVGENISNCDAFMTCEGTFADSVCRWLEEIIPQFIAD